MRMVFWGAAALAAGSVHAQGAPSPPAISTDRPDFTESPSAVPLGRLQVELGATLARDAGTTAVAGPEALVRYAPAAGAELRLALPDVTLGNGPASVDVLGVGGKVELGTVGGWQAGAIAMVGLPLRAGAAVPEAILTVGGDAPFGSLGVQASAAWAGGDAVLGATLVAGRDLSRRVSAFLELAADGVPGDALAVVLHHGYTLAVGRGAQADLHAGAGLTGAAPDAFVGAGWSVRF